MSQNNDEIWPTEAFPNKRFLYAKILFIDLYLYQDKLYETNFYNVITKVFILINRLFGNINIMITSKSDYVKILLLRVRLRIGDISNNDRVPKGT